MGRCSLIHMRQMRRKSAALALTVSMAFGIGCASARINHFKAFSKLGSEYANATSTLMDEAAIAAIDANSIELELSHEARSADERLEAIDEQNTLLATRVTLLHDLKRHAGVLRAYFVALGALAESDAASKIGSSAGNLASSARELGANLRGQAGGGDADSFVEPAVELVVRQFQRKALDDELEARASAIDRELATQQKVLEIITDTLREDIQIALNARELELFRDFQKDKLSKSWRKQRRDLLLTQPSIEAAELAIDAAQQLRLSFRGLLEGRFDASDLEAILGDLSDYVSVIEKIEVARSAR